MAVYLDHAASRPVDPIAFEAMRPWLTDRFGNPSGSHRVARAARAAIDDARDAVAAFSGVAPGNVVFTSGGTESDNLAVIGGGPPGEAVVISSVEHAAVTEAALASGREVRVAPVGRSGVVDVEVLPRLLGRGVSLVSIQLANNETGVVQPFEELAALVRRRAPQAVLHTDAVQAAPWLDLGEECPSADLITLSGHKLGGPQGIGALAIRGSVGPRALIHGGGQEREIRSGTQNVAAIVGFAAALNARAAAREYECLVTGRLRDSLWDAIRGSIADCVLTAADSRRLPGHLHVRFSGVESEALLVLLDEDGVCASAGSACASGAMDASHVILAMGVERRAALSSLRLSLGPQTTDQDVRFAVGSIASAVERLRAGGLGGAQSVDLRPVRPHISSGGAA